MRRAHLLLTVASRRVPHVQANDTVLRAKHATTGGMATLAIRTVHVEWRSGEGPAC